MPSSQLILDRYRIIKMAGSGGYASVYHAYDTRLKRDVAIKTIQLSAADVARTHLVEMEARVQNELDDSGKDGLDILVSGGSLSDNAGSPEEGDGSGNYNDTFATSSEPMPYVGATREFADGQEFPEEADAAAPQRFGSSDASQEKGGSRGSTKRRGKNASPDGSVPHGDTISWNSVGSQEALSESSPARGTDDLYAPSTENIDVDQGFDHIPGLEEARTAAQLSDTNIVTVYDCAVEGSTAYVIMEYIEGRTLNEIMYQLGNDIDLDIIAAVFDSVSHALEVAHCDGVLHLDIKPDNVIINHNGVVKVTDFGLASLMDASGRGTTGGGTIGYMPLEQMLEQPLDVRTDEWALASLTYEMLTGENPFFADSLDQGEAAIENAELLLPSLCWDDLSNEADDVVFTALDIEPDERFNTVEEFAEALEPYLGDAKEGHHELAKLMHEAVRPEESDPVPVSHAPAIPIVDRVGSGGAAVLARVLSVFGVLLVTAIGLMNIRLEPQSTFGLASEQIWVFWGIIAIVMVITVIKPHIGALVSFLTFSVALIVNGAYLLGILGMIATFLWWWFIGLCGDAEAMCALFQPLGGAFGFSAISPVFAGCLLPPGRALGTSIFASFMATIFASFGSQNLLDWDAELNYGFQYLNVQSSYLQVISTPMTWCIIASWIGAALVYSLFCLRGTKAMDIGGSVVAAAILVAGVCFGAWFNTDMAVFAPDAWMMVGALVPGILGIIAACMEIPDAARSIDF